MLPRNVLRLAAALCLWAASYNAVQAQGNFYFITDQAGYTGSWTFYKTLSDAQTGANPVSSGAIPQLNLGVYLTSGIYPPSGGPPNSSIITTNWYSSTNATPGTGNTSNQSLGFFQLYNDPSNPLNTQHTAAFSQDLTSITVSETGKNVKGAPGLESRFSPTAGLGFKETTGEYLSYAFNATATGLNGVPIMGGTAIGDNTGVATNLTGTFNALFQNTGGNAALEGFYAINLNLNGNSTVDPVNFPNFINPNDLFASTLVIPEPASCVTFAMIFAATAGFGWRRTRQNRTEAMPAA
jgi:hypothetical protein